uniref:GCV_T domain-containing protein n=1 Tax=Heligmosomoides polygyrus TaxID=6339 RepID=A0A183FRJ9_HELPZ
LLNTKGRIVDDLIISKDNGDVLVECSASNREKLKALLEKYRMRKSVNVVESHNHVLFSVDEVRGSFPDPRFPPLGRRLYGDETEAKDTGMYHERRMECGVAEGCEELGELLPFHANGDFLKMVSLDKGCYIGQELTARTANTGVIRRRILPFTCEKKVKGLVMQGDKKVGEVISCGAARGLALMSLSAFGQPLQVEGSPIVAYKPAWMPEAVFKKSKEGS